MPELSDQRKWEREMTAFGIARFRAQEDAAIEKGRYTDTSASARLLRVYLSQVSVAIGEKMSSKSLRNKYFKLMVGIELDKLAMFALYRVMECLYKPATLQRVAANIGKMIEDELRFSYFEIAKPEYYNAVQRDLNSRNSMQYRHRHRVLVSTMTANNVEWDAWTNETHIGVGLALLGCVESSTDLVVRKKENGGVVLAPSNEVLEWIEKHDASIEMLLPDRMPCIVPPDDWVNWKEGGFYTVRMRSLTPLVKTRFGQQRDVQSELLDTAEMPVVLSSINAQQRTSWQINRDVLKVVREIWDRNLNLGMPPAEPYEVPRCPLSPDQVAKDLTGDAKIRFEEWKAEARVIHGLEADRKSGILTVSRAMRMATRMEHLDLLWLVYQLDFRSRSYTTTNGVSPQGADVSKALLKFGEARELGARGWYWFQVHGANKYGYDKEDHDDRVQWVRDRSAHIEAAGLDPLGNADVWKDADKPFQFLAWCIEYAAAVRHSGGPEKFMSCLPIALDGSCNGLQHFSAMLRDPVGGRSVNLVPGRKPADIYQDVADVATEKLSALLTQPDHEHYALAANWMALFKQVSNGNMSRKLSKKPVMTLPYGSTTQTCTQSVHGWYLDLKTDFFPKNTAFKHSVFLSSILWQSIGEVVVAARVAMGWLQKVARRLAKHDQPIIYTSPVGFPMVQFSPKMEKRRINAQIGGPIKLQIRTELPGVDMFKAALGSSPNFVHMHDASHMHMTVDRCSKLGITHFAMIHDDFGVHACHVDTLHRVIRETFVEMYAGTNVLQQFKEQQEARTGIELPDAPDQGSLVIADVLKSRHFFG